MKRYLECTDRASLSFPQPLDDYSSQDNPVRVVDTFVDDLDLQTLGFDYLPAAATGRPAFHPAVLVKIYVYGYLDREQSGRRPHAAADRNRLILIVAGV